MKSSSHKTILGALENDLTGCSVLVTGATGFVGANLCRRLLELDASVSIIRRSTSSMWRLNDIKDQLTCYTADLSNYEQFTKTFKASQPEVIFHLATERGIGPEKQLRYINTNILGALHLIKILRQAPAVRLIVTGSSLEYAKSDLAIREDYPLLPDTIHGIAKVSASLLYRQAVLEEQLSIFQLRLFHVYGPWESSHRFLSTAIRLSMNNKPVPLTIGPSRRDWVHIDDVVNALLITAQIKLQSGVYNIASGIEHTNEQVLDLLGEAIGRKVERTLDILPKRPTDNKHRFADISLALNELNWLPKHDLRTGIKDMLVWRARHLDILNDEKGITPTVF